jgi:Flp pilus assembly protein TadG
MPGAVGKNTMRNRKPTTRGGSMVEFTMLIPIWLPLIVGTLWIGSSMVREQQVQQMARDLASMYSRGADFSSSGDSGTNESLTLITQQLGTLTASGTGVVIFSTITYPGNALCPTGCTNQLYFVFRQRYTQGNTSLWTSNFGTPTGTFATDNTGNLTDFLTNANDRTTFSLIPAPLQTGTDGYQAGQPIYVVEVFFQARGLAGYTKGGDYAYAVF